MLQVIANAFGDDVAGDDGLNRSLLAERAFSSPENTALLNRLTHPYITERLLIKLSELTNAGERNIVLDAPQLFESRLNLICDIVVAVAANAEERARRVILRDGLSVEAAEARISAQLSDNFFREHCDFVIENNSSPEELEKSVSGVISRI